MPVQKSIYASIVYPDEKGPSIIYINQINYYLNRYVYNSIYTMPRIFSEHSKQYLKDYFKNRYENDPEFRRRANESNNVSRLRSRLVKKVDMVMLQAVADLYHHLPYVF